MVFELLALTKGSVETLMIDGNQEMMTNTTDDHIKTLAIMFRGAVRLSCLMFCPSAPIGFWHNNSLGDSIEAFSEHGSQCVYEENHREQEVKLSPQLVIKMILK